MSRLMVAARQASATTPQAASVSRKRRWRSGVKPSSRILRPIASVVTGA
ncbi:MAG TPA: hypothetical protein VK614_13885 [Allosphingosinicella sp.]|nr:hypothetical protein [Allosphingosinicella sp.]